MIDFNVLIDEKNFFFDQPIKKIKEHMMVKIATDQGDDYTACCLLDYVYYKIIVKWQQ